MREFKIHCDPLDMGYPLYLTDTFCINSGVTVLVGCNGAGKSTLIQMLMQSLRKDNIPYLSFNNLTEGGDHARSKAGFYNDFEFLATSICSSEGENIIMNMGNYAREIGHLCRSKPEAKELWFFFDAVDSGLSVDNIVELKQDLFQLVQETNPGKDIYIIVSANEYEMARDESCLDVRTGEHVHFSSYEDFREFILESRKLKDRRHRNRGNGNDSAITSSSLDTVGPWALRLRVMSAGTASRRSLCA